MVISADSHEDSRDFRTKLEAKFPFLEDPGVRVAVDYGVAMKDDDIAIPSVIVIARDGTIVWQQVGENMADRATVEDILAAVRQTTP